MPDFMLRIADAIALTEADALLADFEGQRGVPVETLERIRKVRAMIQEALRP